MRGKLHGLTIAPASAADHPRWAAMLALLHDEQAEDFVRELARFTRLREPYRAFIAWDGDEAVGLIDYRVRNYAEGAPDLHAAYVEDLWVDPKWRGHGLASALLAAVEAQARAEGLGWLGSDALLDNVESHAWHRANGFAEVERLVVFGKAL